MFCAPSKSYENGGLRQFVVTWLSRELYLIEHVSIKWDSETALARFRQMFGSYFQVFLNSVYTGNLPLGMDRSDCNLISDCGEMKWKT